AARGGAGRDAPVPPAGGPAARSLNPLLFNYSDSPASRFAASAPSSANANPQQPGAPRDGTDAAPPPPPPPPAARPLPPRGRVAAVARGAPREPDGGLVHTPRDRGHRVRVAPPREGAGAERPVHEAQAAGGQEAGRQVVGKEGGRR
ncbi:hypothetical protein THAOC_34731, partial [Thalassiosira oceanica]